MDRRVPIQTLYYTKCRMEDHKPVLDLEGVFSSSTSFELFSLVQTWNCSPVPDVSANKIIYKNTPFWIQRNFRIVSIEISTFTMELKENEPRNLTDKIVESMSEANAEDYAESEANTYVEPRYGPKPEGEAEPMLKPEPINRPIPVQRINSGSIYENPYSTNVYHDYGGLRIAFDSNDQSSNRKWSLSYLIIALVVGMVIGATVTGLSMHFTSNPVCKAVPTASPMVTATSATSMHVEKLEEEIEILKTNQSNLILDLDNCTELLTIVLTELNLTQARTQTQQEINLSDQPISNSTYQQ